MFVKPDLRDTPANHRPELRERLGELGAALRLLTPGYREALLREDGATAKRRCHGHRRLARLLEHGVESTPARLDGRRYSEEQVQRALALVADGRTLREAGAAVGAQHTTVLRWLRKAA